MGSLEPLLSRDSVFLSSSSWVVLLRGQIPNLNERLDSNNLCACLVPGVGVGRSIDGHHGAVCPGVCVTPGASLHQSRDCAREEAVQWLPDAANCPTNGRRSQTVGELGGVCGGLDTCGWPW